MSAGTVGGCGDRFDHQTFERALAQLADQETRQKFLLARRGAREELGEQTRALSRRSTAAGAGDLVERRIDLGQRETGRYRIRVGLRVAHERVADAAFPLPGDAGEIGHADVDLRGRKAAQEFRHSRDLYAPRRVLADMLRGVDELGEQRVRHRDPKGTGRALSEKVASLANSPCAARL